MFSSLWSVSWRELYFIKCTNLTQTNIHEFISVRWKIYIKWKITISKRQGFFFFFVFLNYHGLQSFTNNIMPFVLTCNVWLANLTFHFLVLYVEANSLECFHSSIASRMKKWNWVLKKTTFYQNIQQEHI